jgi:exopolysaccharide biosynthesis polyprenyl glycosylphosphotransferase
MTAVNEVYGEPVVPPLPRVPDRVDGWRTWYVGATVGVDLVVAVVAAGISLLARFGPTGPPAYMLGTLLFPLVWVVAVAANRAYETRFLAVGSEEFRRVIAAGVSLMATVAFVSYLSKAEISRRYVVVAIPLAISLDIAGRYLLRRWLHRRRESGECMQRVVVVGAQQAVGDLARQLRRERYHGLNVVGACLPSVTGTSTEMLGQVPVLGDVDGVLDVVANRQVDVVAVVSGPDLPAESIRRLAWGLERTSTELVVAPGIMEVAGPRLTIRPVSNLPLLHVEQPRMSGPARLLKSLFDRAMAALALLVLLPLLTAIAVAVRLTSAGPALFHQTRIGHHGDSFRLVKFRTMCVDAEARKAELAAHNENADGLLFKMRRDPRITPLGAVLRRYSLDELPQLINVLLGHMSLVGPRPPLPDEVAAYTDDVRRRLLVKPGLTGLWQVSGRSDLSWDESVRLDLRYVENWSIALDLYIIWRTARVVLRGTGAY